MMILEAKPRSKYWVFVNFQPNSSHGQGVCRLKSEWMDEGDL